MPVTGTQRSRGGQKATSTVSHPHPKGHSAAAFGLLIPLCFLHYKSLSVISSCFRGWGRGEHHSDESLMRPAFLLGISSVDSPAFITVLGT